MSEDPPRDYGPSTPQHRIRTSLITSASGIADSTISFNTYATGITEGSLCLSQFPPPPTTLPSSASPTTERFLPSPARSTFTVTAPQRPGPSSYHGQPSPANSTFTVMTPPQLNPMSGSTSPIVRPVPVFEQGLPSPAQSTFTVSSSPVSANIAPLMPTPGAQLVSSPLTRQLPGDSSPSRGPGRMDRPHNSDSRATPQSATFMLAEGKLSPHDWHEGSSIISVDAQEERMLSTSFITELLSSTASLKSPVDASPRGFHTPSQADVGSLVSEMSYPPSSSRHLAGSSRFPPSSHPSTYPGKGADSHVSGDNDTVASLSYEGQSDIVQPALGLTRKVSLLGMAPARLRQISSATSIPESLHPRSQATYGSSTPLNPHPPSAFSSIAGKMRPSDIQSPIGTPQPPTPERHESLDFDAGRRSSRYQRRESTYSSRTVRSHVTSLISAVGQRTVNVARATMEWMRIKPLPPLPTISNISTHQAQQHRRMEGSLPLPQLAERADRLNVMLDAGHLPHDSVRTSPRLGSDKDSPLGARASGLKLALGNRRRQSVNVRDSQSDCSRSPLKPKSCFRRPMSRSCRIKLFVGASVLALLALIGIVVGVTVGRKNARSPSCSANRTGNTCSLGKLRTPFSCS